MVNKADKTSALSELTVWQKEYIKQVIKHPSSFHIVLNEMKEKNEVQWERMGAGAFTVPGSALQQLWAWCILSVWSLWLLFLGHQHGFYLTSFLSEPSSLTGIDSRFDCFPLSWLPCWLSMAWVTLALRKVSQQAGDRKIKLLT